MSDVVQIRPGSNHIFGGCLAIVRETRSWGLIVDITGPSISGRMAPFIYPCRVSNGDFHYVGTIQWEVE